MFKLISIALFLVIFVLGASFSAVNTSPITIDYYLGTLTLPLAMVVISSMVIGIIIGTLLLATSTLKLKYAHRRLTKKVATLEQEIDAINALPIQETTQDKTPSDSDDKAVVTITKQQTPSKN